MAKRKASRKSGGKRRAHSTGGGTKDKVMLVGTLAIAGVGLSMLQAAREKRGYNPFSKSFWS